MILKNRFLTLLAVALLFLVACGGKDDSGTTKPQQPDTGQDIVDQVSQYEARTFDGTKRADVFYQIFVRSFADSNGDGKGDIKGITQKLDYLDDLGVAGIWLTPIYTTNSYHGYDVIDYRQVNPEYGTVADVEELIREAHSRKIRVILDFVPNHTSNQSEWFKQASSSTTNQYRNYYFFEQNPTGGGWHTLSSGTTDYKYFGDFDSSMPDLNYGVAASCATNDTFKAMTSAAKFWVDKGVDGFRLDAVKHIYSNATSNENPTFLKTFYDELNSYFRGKSTLGYNDIYMVGECWMGTNDMAPYYRGLPALFDFTAWDNYLLYAIQNSHAKWFPKDIIAERATFATYRTDFIQATKLSNHDENRARTSLGGSVSVSLERAKIAAAVLLTSIGSPYIYYGEEIGMLGNKSTGDHNVREPMLWAPKAEDKYRPTWTASANSNDTSVGNVATQAKSATSLYNVYRKFMRLRNTYPALATGDISLPTDFSDTDTTNKQVMVFYRTSGSERLMVIHNVSQTSSTYTINHAIKKPIADMNKVTVRTNSATQHIVSMPAYSSIIIEL